MKRPIAGWWTTGAILATVATLASADITDVTPAVGTVGTQFAIKGGGFGPDRKPSVVLNDGVKAVKLKVVSRPSDTQVSARVVKAHAGVFDLLVQPADKNQIASYRQGAIQIAVGVIEAVTPPNPAPGAEVTIGGSLFGTRKGSVLVGGKKAKIVKGGWSDGQIRAKLHKKTPTGVQSVEVVNAIGTVTKPNAVLVGGG